ncbi:MAG: metallophosphoesterase [bacterium]
MKKIFLCIVVLFFASTLYANALCVRIAQLTDVHIGPKDDEKTATSIDKLNAAIKSINNRNDIDVVVFTGDNIDKSNVKDLKTFCSIVRHLNKPYYVLLGNHDAYKVSGIPQEDYMKAIKATNRKNQKTIQQNFAFHVNKDIEAICLDGTTPNIPSSHGFFGEETIKWFKKTLAKNKNKKIVIFQHFPLIPPEEQRQLRLLEPEEEASILDNNRNIILIASGHYHIGAVNIDENGVYHISTPSLLMSAQYRIIEIDYKKHDKKCFEIRTELVDVKY